MREDIIWSSHCQGLICVICKHWSYSTVAGVHSDFLVRSCVLSPVASHFSATLSIDQHQRGNSLLSPATHGSIHGPFGHFYLPSLSRQTSINGARWQDNEAPRHRLTEVGEWQRHTELSLSRRNERRTWKRSYVASWTNPQSLEKRIPLCLA